jgi:hypothetical protein
LPILLSLKCVAGRHGIWHLLYRATFPGLVDCACGKLAMDLVLAYAFCKLSNSYLPHPAYSNCYITVAFFKASSDLQAVYADAYVKASSNLGPAHSAIVLNELNNYNGQVALAAQKLVLSTTSTARAEQRTL